MFQKFHTLVRPDLFKATTSLRSCEWKKMSNLKMPPEDMASISCKFIKTRLVAHKKWESTENKVKIDHIEWGSN